MALLKFPPNPSVGDNWTVGQKTYSWNGRAWIVAATSATFTDVVASTIKVTSGTNAVSSTTGALQVTGGAAIGGNLYVGGNIIGISTGSGGGVGTISAGTATFTKVIANGGVQATSTTTGDVVISGGIGVGGNMWIGGILYSAGAPVLTTASFNKTLQDGIDIDIVDVGGGVLAFNNISTLQSVTDRGATTTNVIFLTNTTTSTSTTTGALIISGGVGVGGRINSESLKIADTVFDSTVQTVNSVAWTIIDEYSFNQFRSAKYLIQIDEGLGATAKSQVTELLTLATNSGTVFITEYANIMPYGDLGNFDANVVNAGSDNLVRLYFMATDTVPKTVKVLRTAMAK
jgi:hypothetical protein